MGNRPERACPETYLNERAARGRKSKFKKAMKKVPSSSPVEGDQRRDA